MGLSKTDLAIGEDAAMALLWDWWFTTTKALVDTVGSDKAVNALRPYFINANSAAQGIINDVFKDAVTDPDFRPRISCFAMEAWLGGKMIVFAEEDRWESVVAGCRTDGQCKELCQLISIDTVRNSAFLPNGVVEIGKSLSKGDDHCVIIMGTAESVRRERSATARRLEAMDFGPDVLRSFRLQYVGESWVYTTRAFIDCVGSEETIKRLRAYMKLSGLVFGGKIMQRTPSELDLEGTAGLLAEIFALHMRTGTRRSSENGIEEEVSDCPFSQAPPEICLQYEAFVRGLCEAVSPDLEFSYDRMMTAGDEKCHWILKRKGEDGLSSRR
jgi:hypothetical protein